MEEDMLIRIQRDFIEADVPKVLEILNSITQEQLNVGLDQALRSLIYLANGNVNRLITEMEHLKRDPRDVIYV